MVNSTTERILPKNAAISDNLNYLKSLSGVSKLKFWLKLNWYFLKTNHKLKITLRNKKCFYGPFKGEFGHFLAHNLPFLMYLHHKGVKIIYCGLELHKPFMIDEKGNSIFHEFIPLRDFFSEISPNTNSTIPPIDVQNEIFKFKKRAVNSNLPFWDIDNDFYYWYIHRNWLLKGPYLKINKIWKTIVSKKENAVTIFPRKKGGPNSANNGEDWDYKKLAQIISPYFEKVYITGHPALSSEFTPEGNIELALSTDNKIIIDKCSKSRLIITQHSGAVYMGAYTDCQILIIHKGSNPIGSIQNTLRFNKYLNNKYPFEFAFSFEEVVNFVNHFNEKI